MEDIFLEEEEENWSLLKSLSDDEDFVRGCYDFSRDFVPEENSRSSQEGQVEGLEIDETTEQNESVQLHSAVPLKDFPFNTPRGLLIEPESETPYRYFRLLFTQELIDLIVSATNKHAEAFKGVSIFEWKPLTSEEFLIFLGLLLQTGTIKIERLAYYWGGPDLYNGLFDIPFFRNSMSKDRFFAILRCLYFSPIGEEDKNDELYKVRPLIDFFNTTMKRVYGPGQELCIDDSFVPGQRKNYGIKLYSLYEPSGIALKLLAEPSEDEEESAEHREEVVKELVKDFTGKGHALYTSKRYSSIKLSKELLKDNTYTTGTLSKSRLDKSSNVVTAKLKRGEVVEGFTPDGVCVLKWRHDMNILMVSTQWTGELVESTSRRGVVTTRPQAALKYIESISFDYVDHLLTFYPCEQSPLKWYKKLAVHIFHLIFMNSGMLYYSRKGISQPKLDDLHKFRKRVIEYLVSNSRGHFPMVAKKGRKRIGLMCHQCAKENRRKTTGYYCSGCEGRVGLCPECFRPYHTES